MSTISEDGFLDRLRIGDIIARLHRAVDEADGAVLRSIMAEDATLEVIEGDLPPFRLEGLSQILGIMVEQSAAAPFRGQHIVGPVAASISGEKATAKASLLAARYLPNELSPPLTHAGVDATYELIKLDGSWRLKAAAVITRWQIGAPAHG